MPALSQVRLELAREKGHADGDGAHRYVMRLPLNAEGRIDPDVWRANRDACLVHRFRPGEEMAEGKLQHGPGGIWTIDYDDTTDVDDELGFRLGEETFVIGEYISIREDDGVMHTFRVVSVEAV
jgi:hypothetical protein